MKTNKDFEHCNRRKFFVVLALSLCLSFTISPSSASPSRLYDCSMLHPAVPGQEQAITGWILDKTIGNVDFYHAIMVCNGKNAVFLKFNNKNSYAVKVTWKEVFKTRSEERKDGYMGKQELVLASGITTANDCTDVANKKSIILPSQIDPLAVTEILDFSFKEITVTTL